MEKLISVGMEYKDSLFMKSTARVNVHTVLFYITLKQGQGDVMTNAGGKLFSFFFKISLG